MSDKLNHNFDTINKRCDLDINGRILQYCGKDQICKNSFVKNSCLVLIAQHVFASTLFFESRNVFRSLPNIYGEDFSLNKLTAFLWSSTTEQIYNNYSIIVRM